MWFKKTDREEKEKTKEKVEAPEKLRYSRYYEHDGQLRAYANRSMILACLCVPIALVSVAMAFYVRIQPPTVIRVDAAGEASILGQKTAQSKTVTVAQGANTEANEFEKKAFIRHFLDRYLNFSPESVNRNWADALNMMTANLRRGTFSAIEKDNTVGKIQDDQITALFRLVGDVAPSKDDPLTFSVFGVKQVHRVHDHQEATDKLVGEYRIRLISERRTEENPSGLLIAEYGEKLIEGERRDSILQDPALNGTK
jgi:type IV secretory pathway TrbF-like protein